MASGLNVRTTTIFTSTPKMSQWPIQGRPIYSWHSGRHPQQVLPLRWDTTPQNGPLHWHQIFSHLAHYQGIWGGPGRRLKVSTTFGPTLSASFKCLHSSGLFHRVASTGSSPTSQTTSPTRWSSPRFLVGGSIRATSRHPDARVQSGYPDGTLHAH